MKSVNVFGNVFCLAILVDILKGAFHMSLVLNGVLSKFLTQ